MMGVFVESSRQRDWEVKSQRTEWHQVDTKSWLSANSRLSTKFGRRGLFETRSHTIKSQQGRPKKLMLCRSDRQNMQNCAFCVTPCLFCVRHIARTINNKVIDICFCPPFPKILLSGQSKIFPKTVCQAHILAANFYQKLKIWSGHKGANFNAHPKRVWKDGLDSAARLCLFFLPGM